MRLALLALGLLVAGPGLLQASSYGAMQQREIRALSSEQMQDLLAGRGMAQALAAELNGWPGPMHVLEHADALNLTPRQREETEALMAAHRADAIALGTRLVEAERVLDLAFRDRRITAATLVTQTDAIGALQGQLRAEHLRTHLRQTALLSAEQVARYAELRGYAAPAQGAHRHRH